MHVMEEMPFSHGCHDLVAEPEEAVGRLMDMRGANQCRALRDWQLWSAERTQKPLPCVWPWRELSYMWEKWVEHLCVCMCVCVSKYLSYSLLLFIGAKTCKCMTHNIVTLKSHRIQQLGPMCPSFHPRQHGVNSPAPSCSLFLSFPSFPWWLRSSD